MQVNLTSEAWRLNRRQCLLSFLGVAALATGLLVYILDRPAMSTGFLPGAWSLFGGHELVFGAVGGHLPDFLHAYAFILLTVVVSPWQLPLLTVCAFWWLVDSLFELGQHPVVAGHIAAVLPEWFQRVPILDNTANYFLRGTFDPADILSFAFGSLAAYMTVRLTTQREKESASYK